MQIIAVLLILAVVQGVAEFLPISSSGHLVIFENIPIFKAALSSFGENIQLYINVLLHVATLIAVIIYLRKDIARIVKGTAAGLLDRDFRRDEVKISLYILTASVPAGTIGILLHDVFEKLFSSPTIVFFMLILNGFILLSSKIIPIKNRKLEETGLVRALLIGFFQAAAIIPGISRSGITITGGFLAGMAPEDSAKFSFLMAIPVIAGAGLLESVKVIGRGFPEGLLVPLVLSMTLTVAVALGSLRILFALVKRIRIDIFGYYTILVGITGLVIIFFV